MVKNWQENAHREFIDKYRQRKFCDEIDYLNKDLDGITNLLSQLKIDNVDLGITTASVEHRIE